jgi:hypothetical protein
VAEAQERVGSREFAEWRAFFRIEMWPEERQDLRLGILGASLAGLWVNGSHKPRDFMLLIEDEVSRKPPQTTEQMKTTVSAIRRAVSGKKRDK